MNIAINIITGAIFDLSLNPKGSPAIIAAAAQRFKCSNPSCSASVSLCSFRAYNIPAPYFKSLTSHITNCPNTITTFNMGDISGRATGMAAFNAMKRKYGNKVGTQSFVIYVREGNRVSVNDINENNQKSRVKTGPIIFNGIDDFLENTTYIVNSEDMSHGSSSISGEWINFARPIPTGFSSSESIKTALRKHPDATCVLYTGKFRNRVNNGRYSYRTSIMVIDDGIIIAEKYPN